MPMDIYHYTECGLDNVFILADSIEQDDDGEKVIMIPAIGLLHQAITEGVINNAGILNGKEIRFLRTEMEKTQAELAEILHCDSQTIARWEKDEHAISPALDMIIRQLVSEELGIPLAHKDDIKALSQERSDAEETTRDIRAQFNNDMNAPAYTLAA